MSLITQLEELEEKKRLILEGALADIEARIDELKEAGYSYRLVSSATEAAVSPRPEIETQHKEISFERGLITSSPRTILSALKHVENTDDGAFSPFERVNLPGALNSRMEALSDADLWDTLNYFYSRFHNFVSGVAKVTGKSIGHCQRVLDGTRKSAEVKAAIVQEFRRRIQSKDGPKNCCKQGVPSESNESEAGGRSP